MENLEVKSNENMNEVELRCKGWCHKIEENSRIELRCKGWCHDSSMEEANYSSKLPLQKYFCN